MGIIPRFNLRQLERLTKAGFYRKLAVYGHVGRPDLDLPWKPTTQAEALK